jgi:hypothetical protein
MAKDQKIHSGGAESEKGGALRNVILLTLPLFSFQRNVLDLVKTGLEKAVGIKPVQNLLVSEIHAVMMIVDPEHRLRDRLGADLENKIKELADEVADKVISGSVQLVDAQKAVAEGVIDVLQMLKDAPKRSRAKRT